MAGSTLRDFSLEIKEWSAPVTFAYTRWYQTVKYLGEYKEFGV
jgi:hypothetical protein